MKKFLALALVLVLALSVTACSKHTRSYDIGNADRARVFFEKYNSMVEKYGEGKSVDGTLYGAAVVRLYDFTGDGYPEMLLAYSSEKDKQVDSVMVCGFDMGYAEIYNEKITSKESKDAKSETLWAYTDAGNLSYLVIGEDLSAERSYQTFIKADIEGKASYAFAEAFSTDGKDLNGTYEIFDIMGADFKAIDAENQNVLNALETQKN
ncbi:MAG: hypothetical protein IJW04_05910 [Ruminococcus sp.]|nr:hypothetical protein [Ruminococcus sp.]